MGAFKGSPGIGGRFAFRTLCLTALIAAATARPCPGAEDRAADTGPGRRLVVWVLSDIQPARPSERRHFETAVKDAADHLGGIHFALAAGDMLHRSSHAGDWDWFLRTRERAGVPLWFEIAGNHEARNLPYYRERTGKPLHYAVSAGNVLVLCMSNEARGAPTIISDGTFRWWKRMVEQNQEKIIVTMTHATPRRSGLAYTIFPSMIMRDSDRFFNVLKKHRVDLWISGHAHQPYYFGGKNSTPSGLRGTLFVNASSVKEDFPFDPIESRVLYFNAGSRTVLVRTRDHGKSAFVKSQDIEHTLGRPFAWDGSPPRMLP